MDWILGGNTLARVGVVVLLIGVAFLVKYAAQRFTVPIELRLAAIGLVAVAIAATGWRLRAARPGYAVTLQGAGVGMLYLTVYAALALYHVLPAAVAFALLALLGAVAGWLALRQDAAALAVLGALGGYSAPVLTSSAGGSHVVLFGYYAVLNAGVFAIAWQRTWRGLNVLGFVCTFIVATLWGVTRYRAEDFATTEPFLVLHFLFYTGIAVAYGVRQSVALREPVDAALVFGTPIVVAVLQSRLVERFEYGMAISAVAMAALYALLAALLHAPAQPARRPLADAFAALAIVFATLAIPLAFDAHLTSAMWALEGAALCALGLRGGNALERRAGLALQLAAALAFAWGVELFGPLAPAFAQPIVNRHFVGGIVIALAAAFTAWRYDRTPTTAMRTGRAVPLVALAWALAWWVGTGWSEVDRFVVPADRHAARIAWLAITAAALLAAAHVLDWHRARVTLIGYPGLLLLIALPDAAHALANDGHLLQGTAAMTWPGAVGMAVAVLASLEHAAAPQAARAPDFAHAALLWLVTAIATTEIAWLVGLALPGAAWHAAAVLAVPAAAAAAALPAMPWLPVASPRWQRAWRVLGAGTLVVVALLLAVLANFASDGDAAPLPFVPLLNPLDLALGGVALVAVAWWRRAGEAAVERRVPVPAVTALAGLAVFCWLTLTTLRTLHHWNGLPFSVADAWHSPVAQATLALVWAVAALVVMVLANRRRMRMAWLAGAALLALVVVKLFLVDLAQAGTIERIVSFIGVGALLLAVGYLAPVPPRRAEGHRESPV
jgi:uncharacterized membrane protein